MTAGAVPYIKSVTIGATPSAMSAASEEILNAKAVSNQAAHAASPAYGTAANKTPSAVATPFPPLNFSHTGKQWPRTA